MLFIYTALCHSWKSWELAWTYCITRLDCDVIHRMWLRKEFEAGFSWFYSTKCKVNRSWNACGQTSVVVNPTLNLLRPSPCSCRFVYSDTCWKQVSEDAYINVLIKRWTHSGKLFCFSGAQLVLKSKCSVRGPLLQLLFINVRFTCFRELLFPSCQLWAVWPFSSDLKDQQRHF